MLCSSSTAVAVLSPLAWQSILQSLSDGRSSSFPLLSSFGGWLLVSVFGVVGSFGQSVVQSHRWVLWS